MPAKNAFSPTKRLAAPAPSIRLLTVALLWLAPVLLVLVSAPKEAILSTTALAAVVCAAAQVMRPTSIVVTLPFFALLSPVTGLLDWVWARVLFSDLLFCLLAVQAAVSVITRPSNALSHMPVVFRLLAMLFMVSVVVSYAVGYLISLKPLLYLAQLSIVAYFTSNYTTHHQDWLKLQRAWFIASVYGSVIMFQAYSEVRSLDILKDADSVLVAYSDDLSQLFRATYYYSGFHYILGLCIVSACIRLFFPATRVHQLALLLALVVMVLALVAGVNKTAIAAIAVAIIATALALFLRFRREMTFSILCLAALGSGGLAAGIVVLQYDQLDASMQINLIIERLISASSFFLRLEVFSQALTLWSESLWTMLLGFGPDFLDNSGNPAYSILLKTSPITGYTEGTLDSAWLSYLIELGLPGLLLLAALFAGGIIKALRGLRSNPCFDERTFAEASLFGGLVFLVIAMTTQMLGYTKTSWLPLQLLVVAWIGLRTRGAD
jgi:hypothetical protein